MNEPTTCDVEGCPNQAQFAVWFRFYAPKDIMQVSAKWEVNADMSICKSCAQDRPAFTDWISDDEFNRIKAQVTDGGKLPSPTGGVVEFRAI